MGQTTDFVQAAWRADLSALVGVIQPQSYGRKIQLIACAGPANSTLTIYRGYLPGLAGRVSAVYPADVRTYDAAGSAPIDLRPGEPGLFVWTGGATSSTATASASVVSEVY